MRGVRREDVRRLDAYTNTPNPTSGTKRISLTLYVGGTDTSVPPGADGSTTPLVSTADALDLTTAGVTAGATSETNALWVTTAKSAIEAFLTYNNGRFGTFPSSYGSPTSDTSGQTDINGGTQRRTRTWNRTGDDNPQVVLIRDEAMGHTGATGSGRYFFAADVMGFFKSHARL